MKKLIAYIRVSTQKQGASGLGAEAQHSEILRNVREGETLEQVFTEEESGKSTARPELEKALHRARVTGSTLVVAKVDRLARNQAFLSQILESGVQVRFLDIPQVDGPQGTFILQQFAAVAQLEAGLISQRTKAALAAAKLRGVKLGNPKKNGVISNDARSKSIQVRQARAAAVAEDLKSVIEDLRGQGITSLRKIADSLNTQGIRTPSGRGSWSKTSVVNVLKRAA